jgi:gamma-glutamyl:cysteine ligase YbdK (ATP-grasp superfamily)
VPTFTGGHPLWDMAKKKAQRPVEGYGIALEYMVVDGSSLLPVVPDPPGTTNDGVEWTLPENGGLRVLLTKPEKDITAGAKQLAAVIARKSASLEGDGRLLLPGGAHPFAQVKHLTDAMAPLPTWEHSLFRTRTQGYANARGTRIELPLANEDEFGKLHTAIRMVLPLIPAISASSPFMESKRTALSGRLIAMVDELCDVPELMGAYVPEVALDQADYFRIVLEPIARALAERGLTDVVDYQQMNRRAAVPSFDRTTITLTVADMQECPGSDAAVAEMTVAVIKAMKEGRWVSNYLQRAWHESDLLTILKDVAERGSEAVIANRDLLLMFGKMRENATAGELWRHLYQQLRDGLSESTRTRIALILDHGCLAQRILRRTGERPSRELLVEVYRELAVCLKEDRPFT